MTEPTSGVEAGWKLVPLEPTDKMMLMGGFRFAGKVPNSEVFKEVRKGWDDMLSVAPEPPAALATPAASPATEDANDKTREFWQRWAARRLEISRTQWLKAAKRALAGDMRELRVRVDQIEADPAPILASGEAASPSPAPAAVEATCEQSLQVAIKPLQWRGSSSESPVGEYIARKDFDAGDNAPWDLQLDGMELGGDYASLQEAKAAAQADYTARVLSALDTIALSTLAADKARVEVERDAHEGNSNENYQRWVAAEARASALEGEVERLKEALRPFAMATGVLYHENHEDHDDTNVIALTARDLRKARAAWDALSPAKETP